MEGVGFVAEGDSERGLDAAEGVGEGNAEVDGGGGEGEGGACFKREVASAEGESEFEQDETADDDVVRLEVGDGTEWAGSGEQ